MNPVYSILRRARAAAKRRFINTGVILIYHRVADEPFDPWRLCVTPENFVRQLEVLRALDLRLVHVSELARDLQLGSLRRRTVAITFDDGYNDNLEYARPILERFEAPATLFATAGYIDRDEEFWWDVLDRIFLQPGDLPQSLELSSDGRTLRWDLGSAASLSDAEFSAWPAWAPMGEPPTMRHRIHDELWRVLLISEQHERERLVSELFRWARVAPNARPSRRPLTADQLRLMSRDGLVEVGAHSLTHPALSALPAQAQAHELSRSKERLEALLGTPILGCSYPNGRANEETEEQTRKAGYAFACGSVSRAVTRRSDRYQLPRISARNWGADQFNSFLRSHLAA
jgi:peptidoglycan/xylan/chitin deacetylase (PgdA/CDA1 family)